jgi:hypothetical protein
VGLNWRGARGQKEAERQPGSPLATDFYRKEVRDGRLLSEGQEKGRDEGPGGDHDEEWPAGDDGDVPDLRDQDLQDRQDDGLGRTESERAFTLQ